MKDVPMYVIEEAKRLGYIQSLTEPNVFVFMNGGSYLLYNGNSLVSVVKN